MYEKVLCPIPLIQRQTHSTQLQDSGDHRETSTNARSHGYYTCVTLQNETFQTVYICNVPDDMTLSVLVGHLLEGVISPLHRRPVYI